MTDVIFHMITGYWSGCPPAKSSQKNDTGFKKQRFFMRSLSFRIPQPWGRESHL